MTQPVIPSARDSAPSGVGFFWTGGVFVLLGLAAGANLYRATIAASFVIEASLLGAGAMLLAHALREGRHFRTFLWSLIAVLYVGASIGLVLNGAVTIRAVTIAMAVLLIATGALRMAMSIIRPAREARLFAASGAVAILAGIAIAIGWPDDALWVLGLILALDLLVQGLSFLVVGLVARAERRTRVAASAHPAA